MHDGCVLNFIFFLFLVEVKISTFIKYCNRWWPIWSKVKLWKLYSHQFCINKHVLYSCISLPSLLYLFWVEWGLLFYSELDEEKSWAWYAMVFGILLIVCIIADFFWWPLCTFYEVVQPNHTTQLQLNTRFAC